MKTFVYGTLKRGFRNHAKFMATAQFLGEATTVKKYKMLDLGHFPGVVDGEPEVQIAGEVFEINEDTLAALDHLEGHPDFYERQVVGCILDGKIISASMYILKNKRRVASVPSGIWVNRETSPVRRT